MEREGADAPDFDVIVVGAGFAGMSMLQRLREIGMTAHVYEAGGDVGGTWYWNRYPGARCDAESLVYSLSFSEDLDQQWNWTERFATQPEILRYQNHVADRFDLRRDISFNTRVVGARYDAARNLWTITTESGAMATARYFISAVGCLSVGRIPGYPGLDSFKGRILNTAQWPHEPVALAGQRIGVIGTGSSGIQFIPVAAEQAAHLTVFQRTPNYSVPAQNQPLAADVIADVKQRYSDVREESRLGIIQSSGDVLMSPEERAPAADRAVPVPEDARNAAYEQRWRHGGAVFLSTFGDLMFDLEANATAADFVRAKIRAVVDDPATAALLSPTDYPLGAKRICLDTGYYATFNRDNVSLVDIRADPIDRFTASGIALRSGAEHAFDMIVFATGFDAITGPLLAMDIRGRDGLRLADAWADGPHAYLGIAVAGFPNMFTITGPLSPSVLSNVVVSIEQHVEWIRDCLVHMREQGIDRIEADKAAQEEWVDHVRAIADMTVFSKGASWYNGANIPGKPRTFLAYAGGVGAYRAHCEQVRDDGYRGFTLSQSELPAA